MCTFMNSLPTHSASAESTKKQNLGLFIRPTPQGEYYKLRILAFKSSSKNDRDYPFIERYIHTHWGVDPETGKRRIDGQVVCPVTKFAHTEGNPYDECPICRYANMNFLACKESGWKDKDASKKNREFGRKFEAIIPVYVVNDPTYPQNNNKFRAMIFTDKKFYKEFKAKLGQVSREVGVFNNGPAVDFYIHMTQQPKKIYEGTPNERIYNENVIDRWGFTKAEKAYEIQAITREAIDNFEFDETYYVTSTKEELQEFYNQFIKVSNDDIPEEDVPVQKVVAPVKKVATKPTVNLSNPKPTPAPVVESTEDDDLLDDMKDIEDDIPAAKTTNTVPELMDDDEDLLAGLDDITIG